MQRLKDFSFQCEFCNHVSMLDFHKFSHPDIILHLKHQKEKNDKIRKALDELYSLLN